MKTRWIMRSLGKKTHWETAGKFTREEAEAFLCSQPVQPITSDPLVDPKPGDLGSVFMGEQLRVGMQSSKRG